jgi:hypothetical protein
MTCRRLPSRILLITLAVSAVCIKGQARPPRPDPVVELKAVKYAGLVEAVRARRGRVVVVDVWGVY